MPIYDGPCYVGTAEEQWATAGLDVATGRITATELHALGVLLFTARAEARQRTRDKINRLEDRVELLKEEVNDAECGERDANLKAAKLLIENEELKQCIRELEGNRG